MKRFMSTVALAVLTAALPLHAAPSAMSVQVKQGEIRETPSPLAKVLKTVDYGLRLKVLETKGSWTRVETEDGSLAGWIHSASLTKKKLSIKAGEKDADVAASAGEMAHATKGFNSDVETDFKKKNAEIDFKWVDKMQTLAVDETTMKIFIAEGKLVEGTGK